MRAIVPNPLRPEPGPPVVSFRKGGNIRPAGSSPEIGASFKKQRGIALNPKNKELVVADMRLNSVMTYYFPEIF